MTKVLAERVTLAVGLLGLVAFLVGLGRSSEVVVGLGAVGFVYYVLFPPALTAFILLAGYGHEMWRWLVAMWALLIPSFVFEPPTLSDSGLNSFGMHHWTGVGVFAGASAVLLLVAYVRYREAHKVCPDCAETVLAEAKVCRYCGFRWAARPPVPENAAV
jgi:hypothetical protein